MEADQEEAGRRGQQGQEQAGAAEGRQPTKRPPRSKARAKMRDRRAQVTAATAASAFDDDPIIVSCDGTE